MANIASQKKRNRQNEKRRQRNVAVRSELKTRIKAVQTSSSGDGDGLDDKLALAQRRLDKAATKGVIHKNQAARRTSRLMKAANKHDA